MGSEVYKLQDRTDLPAFNDFQQAVYKLLDGHAREEELLQVHQQLEQVMGQILFYFSDQIDFQPSDPQLDEYVQQVYNQVNDVRDEAELSCKAALSTDKDEAVLHLQASHQAMITLQAVFAEIKSLEDKQPRFSSLPWMHEVCRVALACRRGQLSEEHLSERVDMAQQLHDNAVLYFSQLSLPPTNQQFWHELLAAVGESLDEIAEGLAALRQFLQTGQVELLDVGVELCMNASEQLVDDCEAIEKFQEQAPVLACPRCGKHNAPDVSRCGHCLSPLPRIDIADSTVATEAATWPAHIEKLIALLEEVQDGLVAPEEVLAEIKQLQLRFEKGLQSLEGMKLPAQQLTAEEETQVQELRLHLMSEAQAAIDELAQVSQALRDAHWDRLQLASSQFLLQVEGLMQAIPQ